MTIYVLLVEHNVNVSHLSCLLEASSCLNVLPSQEILCDKLDIPTVKVI